MQFKTLLTILPLVAMTAGCFSNNTDGTDTTESSEPKVRGNSINLLAMKGYLSFSEVFLDLDGNGVRSLDEPEAVTDRYGFLSYRPALIDNGSQIPERDYCVTGPQEHCLPVRPGLENGLVVVKSGIDALGANFNHSPLIGRYSAMEGPGLSGVLNPLSSQSSLVDPGLDYVGFNAPFEFSSPSVEDIYLSAVTSSSIDLVTRQIAEDAEALMGSPLQNLRADLHFAITTRLRDIQAGWLDLDQTGKDAVISSAMSDVSEDLSLLNPSDYAASVDAVTTSLGQTFPIASPSITVTSVATIKRSVAAVFNNYANIESAFSVEVSDLTAWETDRDMFRANADAFIASVNGFQSNLGTWTLSAFPAWEDEYNNVWKDRMTDKDELDSFDNQLEAWRTAYSDELVAYQNWITNQYEPWAADYQAGSLIAPPTITWTLPLPPSNNVPACIDGASSGGAACTVDSIDGFEVVYAGPPNLPAQPEAFTGVEPGPRPIDPVTPAARAVNVLNAIFSDMPAYSVLAEREEAPDSVYLEEVMVLNPLYHSSSASDYFFTGEGLPEFAQTTLSVVPTTGPTEQVFLFFAAGNEDPGQDEFTICGPASLATQGIFSQFSTQSPDAFIVQGSWVRPTQRDIAVLLGAGTARSTLIHGVITDSGSLNDPLTLQLSNASGDAITTTSTTNAIDSLTEFDTPPTSVAECALFLEENAL